MQNIKFKCVYKQTNTSKLVTVSTLLVLSRVYWCILVFEQNIALSKPHSTQTKTNQVILIA